MFGLLKTSGCGWTRCERSVWVGHLCGTCVALREYCGQAARLTTNYDAALVSVLCEAQAAAPLPRTTNVCALRGWRRRSVVAPSSPPARFAASLATLMGATLIEDHVADGDTWMCHFPTVMMTVAQRWKKSARRLASGLDFDVSGIESRVAQQAVREQEVGRDFLFYSQPTEASAAAAFAHTAVLARRPENGAVLREIGRMVGRLIYLLDAFRDREKDGAKGRFNALTVSYPEAEIRPAAARLITEAHGRLRELYPKLSLRRTRLARRLLIDELGSVGQKAGAVEVPPPPPPGAVSETSEAEVRKKKKKDGWCCGDCSCCCCDRMMFRGKGHHGCCCCCDCDCCDCDCCECDC